MWLRPVAAGVAFAVVAGMGLMYTFDSASFDAVRWNVSEAAVHAGWHADRIAGNFEWVNYHAGAGTRASSSDRREYASMVAPRQASIR